MTGDPQAPPVTVTVLAYRSAATSVRCVRSVLDDAYPGAVEVRVREQGGDDLEYRALQELTAGDHRVWLERGPNLGFCDGHDRLLRGARGEVLVLLNADAWLRPGFLAAVVRAFGDPAVGSVQPLVRQAADPSRVDAAGLELHRTRRVAVAHRGELAAVVTSCELWGADGAVLVLRREAADGARDAAGRLFPAEFVSFKEDVELAWRLRRLGWRCVLVPEAEAEHVRGTAASPSPAAELRGRRSRSPDAHIGGFVNLRLTRIRHERAGRLLLDLPAWLPRELAAWVALLQEPRAVLAVLSRLRHGVPAAWRARRAFAPQIRVVDDQRWMRCAGAGAGAADSVGRQTPASDR